MSDDLKFLADASLAGLARWLRLLGFDTKVYSGPAGRPMMKMALCEQRIVLTRRRDMMERQFSGKILLIPEFSTNRQLYFVVNKLNIFIRSEKMHSICLLCNEKLRPIKREDVRNDVPVYVFENCEEYFQCHRCGKIYWPGTHVRNTRQFLKINSIRIDI